jgi:hypothetical protein
MTPFELDLELALVNGLLLEDGLSEEQQDTIDELIRRLQAAKTSEYRRMPFQLTPSHYIDKINQALSSLQRYRVEPRAEVAPGEAPANASLKTNPAVLELQQAHPNFVKAHIRRLDIVNPNGVVLHLEQFTVGGELTPEMLAQANEFLNTANYQPLAEAIRDLRAEGCKTKRLWAIEDHSLPTETGGSIFVSRVPYSGPLLRSYNRLDQSRGCEIVPNEHEQGKITWWGGGAPEVHRGGPVSCEGTVSHAIELHDTCDMVFAAVMAFDAKVTEIHAFGDTGIRYKVRVGQADIHIDSDEVATVRQTAELIANNARALLSQ